MKKVLLKWELRLHQDNTRVTFNHVNCVSLLQIPHTNSSIFVTHHSSFTWRRIYYVFDISMFLHLWFFSPILTIRQDFASGGLAGSTLEGLALSGWDLPHPHVAVVCSCEQHWCTGMPLQPLARKQARQNHILSATSYNEVRNTSL